MNSNALAWLVCGAVAPSLLLSWAVCHLVRRRAAAWGLVDQPGDRKVHQHPTPLGGGLGIWLGVTATLSAATLVAWLPEPLAAAWLPSFALTHLSGIQHRTVDLLVLLSAGAALMLTGLADDRKHLDWRWRLGLEFLVATACVIWQGWTLTAFIPAPWLTGLLSVIWIVALINSFNMLDNMDGLSAGVAALSSATLAVFLLFPGTDSPEGPQLFVAGFLLTLVGGLLGFLVHNRPPARLFMGDAGSYFVGFCIAVATLLATYTGFHGAQPHSILAPLCVMAVPIYDMTTVLWIRVREGRSLFQADKCHFSHRLVELGLSKTQAVLTIYLLTATCGLCALLLRRVDLFGAGVIVLVVCCVLTLIHILETSARRKMNE